MLQLNVSFFQVMKRRFVAVKWFILFRPLDQTTSELPEKDGIQPPGARPVGTVPSELFWKYAGDDHVVDARDLRDLINLVSKQGE